MNSTLVVNGVGYVNIHERFGLILDMVAYSLENMPHMDEYCSGTLGDLWEAIAPRERHAVQCLIRNYINNGGNPVHLRAILDL